MQKRESTQQWPTMNYPGGLNVIERKEREARMYENDNQDDGYTALKHYLQKANPKCTAFFQYPKKTSAIEDAVWYEARPLGINSLAKIMKTISEEARLSQTYNNHCNRATAITLWSNAGISNRHIMAISGHPSEQSLVSYHSRPSTSQLHDCSDAAKSCQEFYPTLPLKKIVYRKFLSNLNSFPCQS